jgi:alpha-L-fucosidase 2
MTLIDCTGSYAGAGHLISTISSTGRVSKYGRWLDLDQAIARTTWTQDETTYMRLAFPTIISFLIPDNNNLPL